MKSFIKNQVAQHMALSSLLYNMRMKDIELKAAANMIARYDEQAIRTTIYNHLAKREVLIEKHNTLLAEYKLLVDSYAQSMAGMIDNVIEHMTGIHPYRAASVQAIPEPINVAA